MEKARVYRNPCVTVDAIIEMDGGIVLIQRGKEPFKGMWALPGGHLDYGESLENAVARETFEESGLMLEELRQVHAYSDPGRDPRGHYISVTFTGKASGTPRAGDDANYVRIFHLDALPPLAFDHAGMIRDYFIWKAGQKSI
ncbi:MAG TPA: NUDIX hydrolase [Nanoarchaeota archaeon]|nr:NUDIX hydrolase [Nanoarchaeota archaeon]